MFKTFIIIIFLFFSFLETKAAQEDILEVKEYQFAFKAIRALREKLKENSDLQEMKEASETIVNLVDYKKHKKELTCDYIMHLRVQLETLSTLRQQIDYLAAERFATLVLQTNFLKTPY